MAFHTQRNREGKLARLSELPPKAEVCDDFAVALYVDALDIVEHAAAAADDHQEATTAVVVLLVHLQMLCQVGDPLGHERDLHLGGPGVSFVDPVVFDGLNLVGHKTAFLVSITLTVVEVAAGSDEPICIAPTPKPERTRQYYGATDAATTSRTHAEGNSTVTLAKVLGAVSISKVSKTFASRGRRGPGPVVALASVDLEIEAGEAVTLLGPSGGGKTTLLRLIAGLENTTSGSITIDGQLPAETRSRKQIAFVPQAPALLPWRTVAANARVLLDVNPNAGTKNSASVNELLQSVGLGDFTEAYPHELSGGMQQRVGLVRAFALDAPLILMDEPFAALDELTRADMRHLLVQLRDQRSSTLVFVTHSISEAVFLSDRIVVMSGRPGRITQLIDVPLERPRQPELEDEPEFFAITRQQRHELSKSRSGS